jgi:hypothetical protein
MGSSATEDIRKEVMHLAGTRRIDHWRSGPATRKGLSGMQQFIGQ